MPPAFEFDWSLCECGCGALRPMIVVGDKSKVMDVWLYKSKTLFLLYYHHNPESNAVCSSNFYTLREAEKLLRGNIEFST